ncbi:MAG TPA: XdhC/CoxI family protein [Candidatus Polarisedimenticolaceae bacterium]|nr:XdhC/CoxI family protein [Candidatus Polarisedimenticolaceae bacterium]
MREVLEAFLEELSAGRRAALATIVRATGSTPRTVGARMLLRADGTSSGTIGGGAFEAMVAADARELLAADHPAPVVKRYAFTEEGKDALGMACGGSAEVLIEVGGAGPRLVVFGAGHVGLALARLASTVGFTCEVVDDRPEAVEAARAAGFGRAVLCGPMYASGIPALDDACFVAVVTRCHRTDRLALAGVLRRPSRYVGLIGSRRKRTVIFEQLHAEDGITHEALERVRCPIGLPLGGDTPEEIAVSIVAELLQVRHRAS